MEGLNWPLLPVVHQKTKKKKIRTPFLGDEMGCGKDNFNFIAFIPTCGTGSQMLAVPRGFVPTSNLAPIVATGNTGNGHIAAWS